MKAGFFFNNPAQITWMIKDWSLSVFKVAKSWLPRNAVGIQPLSAVWMLPAAPGWNPAQMQQSLTIILFRFDCTWCRRPINKTMGHEHNSIVFGCLIQVSVNGGWQVFCLLLLRHCWCAAEEKSLDLNVPGSTDPQWVVGVQQSSSAIHTVKLFLLCSLEMLSR